MAHVKYGEALARGLEFGASPRMLPLLLADLAFLALAIGAILPSAGLLLSSVGSGVNPAAATGLVGGVVVLVVAWLLVKLWIVGAVVHQTHWPREFRKSWHASFARFASLLLAVLLIVIVSALANVVPVAGQAANLVIAVALFFVIQSVMVKHRPAVRALQESYALFAKNREPLEPRRGSWWGWLLVAAAMGIAFGFLYAGSGPLAGATFWIVLATAVVLVMASTIARAWALISLVSGAIVLVFTVPAIALGLSAIGPQLFALGGIQLLVAMALFFLTNPHLLFVMGAIVLVGTSIATAFTLKAQTEFYVQLKKRMGILF